MGPGFWALIGLAGVLGGVMRCPFTGVIFALELTHRWNALLPLIIGASVAYAVSVLLLRRSVLTEKLARRGYHLSREYDVDPLEVQFVDEAMATEVLTFDAGLTVDEALGAITGTDPQGVVARRQMLYPVMSDDGTMSGVVTRTMLETAVFDGRGSMHVLQLCRRDPVVAHPDETLRIVVQRMATESIDRMPVVALDDPTRLVGMVTITDLLAGRVRDLREQHHAERLLVLRRRPHAQLRDANTTLAQPR